jgi:hypothetical protein
MRDKILAEFVGLLLMQCAGGRPTVCLSREVNVFVISRRSCKKACVMIQA